MCCSCLRGGGVPGPDGITISLPMWAVKQKKLKPCAATCGISSSILDLAKPWRMKMVLPALSDSSVVSMVFSTSAVMNCDKESMSLKVGVSTFIGETRSRSRKAVSYSLGFFSVALSLRYFLTSIQYSFPE